MATTDAPYRGGESGHWWLLVVRDVLERHVDAGYVPGAVAVVARHGEFHIEATRKADDGGLSLKYAKVLHQRENRPFD
jgi:hypothetical protein